MKKFYKKLDEANFPVDVDTYLRKVLRVRIEKNQIPGGCVEWDGNHFTLVLSSATLDSSVTHFRNVVLHELMHIIRGDCQAMAGLDELKQRLYNIAADCSVNDVLSRTTPGYEESLNGITIEVDGKTYPLRMIDYARDVAPLIGMPPSPVPTTLFIYQKLLELLENGKGDSSLLPSVQIDIGARSDISEEEKAAMDVETELARGMLLKSEESREMLGGLFGAPTGTNLNEIEIKPQVIPCDWISKLHRRLAKEFSTAKARSYRREGRIPVYRGWSRKTNPVPKKLYVALDASGSMGPAELEVLAGYLRYIASTYDLQGEVWVFDTEVVERYPLKCIPNRIPGGGGTDYDPVFNLAKEKHADLLVLCTDGYPYRWTKQPPFDVFFVLTADSRRYWPDWAKECDYVLVERGEE